MVWGVGTGAGSDGGGGGGSASLVVTGVGASVVASTVVVEGDAEDELGAATSAPDSLLHPTRTVENAAIAASAQYFFARSFTM
nr:hypothetical protein [Rhodococcus sp. (in: high G+C Gram-positive bacteria)]